MKLEQQYGKVWASKKVFFNVMPLAKDLCLTAIGWETYIICLKIYYLIFRALCRINAYSELIPSALGLEIEL